MCVWRCGVGFLLYGMFGQWFCVSCLCGNLVGVVFFNCLCVGVVFMVVELFVSLYSQGAEYWIKSDP